MSVNLLNAVGPVTIPDELESFVLILIYYATRYLESNILFGSDVASFIDECFDCYTIESNVIVCGERKASIVVGDGKLLRSRHSALVPISFCRPLDTLLGHSLVRFKALYKVRFYDAWAAKNPNSSESLAPIQLSNNPEAINEEVYRGLNNEESKFAKFEAEWETQDHSVPTKKPPEPTQQERDLADNMRDHTWIDWAFEKALRIEDDWDRAVRHPSGDRVPKGWKSTHAVVPTSGTSPGQKMRNTAIAQLHSGRRDGTHRK